MFYMNGSVFGFLLRQTSILWQRKRLPYHAEWHPRGYQESHNFFLRHGSKDKGLLGQTPKSDLRPFQEDTGEE